MATISAYGCSAGNASTTGAGDGLGIGAGARGGTGLDAGTRRADEWISMAAEWVRLVSVAAGVSASATVLWAPRCARAAMDLAMYSSISLCRQVCPHRCLESGLSLCRDIHPLTRSSPPCS